MKIALLTGNVDPHYQLDLLSGLLSQGIEVDFIGSDAMEGAAILKHDRVTFYNLRGSQNPRSPFTEKIFRIIRYYYELITYAARSCPKVFHIQWPNKFTCFDRTLLNIYYKMLGKKLVFTAHNVNAGARDGDDSFLNRLTLRCMYALLDHIIVHTPKMKQQLVTDFHLAEKKITVIPHGINNVIPDSDLSAGKARKRLNLEDNRRVLLFFGNIVPYKGLEYLISALSRLQKKADKFSLIIAGRAKIREPYWQSIQQAIDANSLHGSILERIEFIPDEDIEIYFKAADALVLPYTYIFQSGPLFVSYKFGLPIIATDVGSFREDIIEGTTGFICRPEDPDDLARTIDLFFQSDLYKSRDATRKMIIDYAREKYSWEKIGKKTCEVYKNLI